MISKDSDATAGSQGSIKKAAAKSFALSRRLVAVIAVATAVAILFVIWICRHDRHPVDSAAPVVMPAESGEGSAPSSVTHGDATGYSAERSAAISARRRMARRRMLRQKLMERQGRSEEQGSPVRRNDTGSSGASTQVDMPQ